MTTAPDSRLRAAYAARASDAPTTPHPAPEAIAAAVERADTEAEQLAILDHIGCCTQCRGEFDLLRATHIAARQMAPNPWRARGLSLAAAAAIIVGVGLTVARDRTPQLRGAPSDRGATHTGGPRTIALIAPVGPTSATMLRFVWHPVAAAGKYHLELLDDSGSVVLHADTPDTTFTARALTPGRAYRWWVQARVDGEGWQSDFAELLVRPIRR